MRVSDPAKAQPATAAASELTSQRRAEPAERYEPAAEHTDRNFDELVQELRVAQTGVQVLFAFLLSLTFFESFPHEDRTFAIVLTAALLTAAGAALCFMAPVAVHRLHFRQGLKERLLWMAHAMALAGLALLLAAMDLALWLVLAYLWTQAGATAFAIVLPILVVLLWVALPSHLIKRWDSA